MVRLINSKVPSARVRIVEAEVYSRVVGYYRPVQSWNDGKKQEFSERKMPDSIDLKGFKRGEDAKKILER
jgi:hypothetical protein